MLVTRILFGLTGSGNGFIWQPGTKPVPDDLKPFRVWSAFLSTKRDLLFGLAVSEMGDLIHDRKSSTSDEDRGGQTHESSREPDAGSQRGLVDADFNPALAVLLRTFAVCVNNHLQRMRGSS